MKANIYVDGFNLYYGALKNTPYRWLNIAKLCRIMLPRDNINQIKYFTALVNPRPTDPNQLTRQQTYLRALQTIPNLEIIYGHFLTHEIMMPLAPPKSGYAKVVKTEEKGSDVNLALHLLSDGYKNTYDVAVVISNDSDLLLPIQFVKKELGKKIGVLNPQKHPSKVLTASADFVKNIRKGVLSKSLFPTSLTDSQGKFTKPATW
ncbi:MAG: NYN domain-containing protein [Anaerolineae bacterium]|nr:NYN domain-containing protein [Anaerolineae bacterium]MCO5193433.1 NYN domain-containing protein [Anaerolineae bacterium]MCO5198950.1 NYN domain-containing protein [Anaerolineae bacterium]MCO5204915.1 NYN domain-containing protein [Anaerolineae bacterium]